ncbi:MAG: hypothetical protein WBX25_13175, partial [Rhodomicrobium sp.]
MFTWDSRGPAWGQRCITTKFARPDHPHDLAGKGPSSRAQWFDAPERVRPVQSDAIDKRIIRLIQKWLKAGILEDGAVTVSDRGTGQGSVASPLLANI